MADPDTPETVFPGVTRSWRADQNLVIYTLENTGRPLINAVFESMKQILETWPKDQALRVVYEIVHMESIPALRHVSERVREVTQNPNLPRRLYIASIIPNTFVVSAARVIASVNVMNTAPGVKVSVEMFTERQKAFDWITAQPD